MCQCRTTQCLLTDENVADKKYFQNDHAPIPHNSLFKRQSIRTVEHVMNLNLKLAHYFMNQSRAIFN